jgi:hypothetical protein
VTEHNLVGMVDLGWQATGFTTPAVYRVDVSCSCGEGSTITSPAGRETVHQAAVGWHNRHALLAALEERLVRAFTGADLLPGSTFQLTERAAARMARIALDVFITPPEPDESEDAASWSPDPEEGPCTSS